MGWRYRVDGRSLRLGIYDPNWPDRDDVELLVTIDDSHGPSRISLAQSTGEPLLGFFLARYAPPRGGLTG
jgi:hypothetical protein